METGQLSMVSCGAYIQISPLSGSMTDANHTLMVEIDRMVARLEEDYPSQEVFEALAEYVELADELGFLR